VIVSSDLAIQSVEILLVVASEFAQETRLVAGQERGSLAVRYDPALHSRIPTSPSLSSPCCVSFYAAPSSLLLFLLYRETVNGNANGGDAVENLAEGIVLLPVRLLRPSIKLARVCSCCAYGSDSLRPRSRDRRG